MRQRKSVYRNLHEINITSLVDVALTMLIVFMMTAPYIQGGVEVNLPEAETREVITKEGPVISLTKNQQIFYEEDAVTMQELTLHLQGLLPEKDTVPIYLKADEEIPYGFVLQVMAAIEREGFTNLSLMADLEK